MWEAAKRIISHLKEKSNIVKLQSNPTLLFNLNSNVTRLVLSEPTLCTQSCIAFFKFLGEFESNLKPNLAAVVTLSHRLYTNRRFNEMRSLLTSVVNDGFYERPNEDLGSTMVDCDISGEKFEFWETFFDLVFRVYADNGIFEEVLRVFDYIVKKRLSIDERSCIKPEAYTYNTIISAYVKQRDFSGVEEVLKMMKKNGVKYNKVTYTLLMQLSVKMGKMNDAEKLFDEMRERGIESNIHLYTSLISWNCRKGDIKRALLLFDELTEKGLSPSSHTYGALIDRMCKVGEMDGCFPHVFPHVLKWEKFESLCLILGFKK